MLIGDHMAKRKRKNLQPPDRNQGLQLLELQCGIISHCAALKAVTEFLTQGKTDAAVVRLDQATKGLHALVRGQCEAVTKACPQCGESQGVVQWVDSGQCDNCGAPLKIPSDDE